MSNTKVSRRDFVKASAMVATLTGVTAPFNILAAGESPNSQVNGVILGYGWRGTQLLPQWKRFSNVIGICDPKAFSDDLDLVKNLYGKCSVKSVIKGIQDKRHEGIPRYQDYRKMFEKIGKDIDAVYMHMRCGNNFHVAMTAMEMGINVYVEKPMCYTVEEARRLKLKAKEKNLVTQFGTQGHSGGGPQLLREWVEKGWLGKNVEVHAIGGNIASRERKLKPEEIPSVMNWDIFQGPAKVTDYNHIYATDAGKFKDFSIGGCGEIAIHATDGGFHAMNVTHPKTFGLVDMPAGEAVAYKFPKKGGGSDWNYYLYDSKVDYLKLPLAEKFDYQNDKTAAKIRSAFGPSFVVGDKETAYSTGYSNARIWNYDRMRNFVAEHGQINPAKYAKDHLGSFIQAIKDSKPKDALANFEDYGSNIMEMLCLNVIARTLKKKGKIFEFDSENLKITNDDDANALISREYRDGFKI